MTLTVDGSGGGGANAMQQMQQNVKGNCLWIGIGEPLMALMALCKYILSSPLNYNNKELAKRKHNYRNNK